MGKRNDMGLEEALKQINKRYGDRAIGRAKDMPRWEGEAISTGSLQLDRAIGVGGFPRGRTSVLWGKKSSGKTTICQHLIANAQAAGITAAFIDMEFALDKDYAEKCGVDWDTLLTTQPDSGEQALEIAEALARSGQVGLIVIDSVAKLIPTSEIEGDVGDATMGSQARLMSQGLRKLGPVVGKNNVALVFTNQIRHRIGVNFGSPEYMPGGFALEFEASVIVKLSNLSKGTDDKKTHIKARVIKNKVAAPFQTVEFDIYYNRGIDRAAEVIDLSLEKGLLERRGSYVFRGDDNVGRKDDLKDNPDLVKELTEQILEAA